ncbi:MAG: radical SAM protein [Vallitaleaceae bacterium]|nr:radical SAM protein [Vallitaleaceae bacterium]
MVKSNPLTQLNNIVPIIKGRIPGQVIIQYTTSCNATCPQCGMRVSENFKRTKLPESEVKKIIDSAASQGVEAISFTGGEPFLYEAELLNLINYASKSNIEYIRTGTNGFMFRNSESAGFEDKIHRLAESLSKTKLRNFWISIDSAEAETHEKMRGLEGVIKGIEKALPIFHEYNIYPAANLGINRNTGGLGKIPNKMINENAFYMSFREAFKSFYEFIISLGFTMVNSCYPMSVDQDSEDLKAVYGATSTSNIVSFSKREKIQIFNALYDTIPEYRSKIRIFTPRVSLYSLIRQYEGNEGFPLPCRGGKDFFFIDANDGNTYPCGYRGDENLGKFYDLDVKSLKSKAFCQACDWECFRDPSELIGYLIYRLANPLDIFTNTRKDDVYNQLWKEDIRYYKACDYFDGRKAPQMDKWSE